MERTGQRWQRRICFRYWSLDLAPWIHIWIYVLQLNDFLYDTKLCCPECAQNRYGKLENIAQLWLSWGIQRYLDVPGVCNCADMAQNFSVFHIHGACYSNFKKKQKQRITSVGKDVEKLEPSYIVMDCQMVPHLWKIVWQFLKILNIELSYNPATPLLGL